jgi:hypothetical protein
MESNRRLSVQQEALEREWFNKEYCRAGKSNEFSSRLSQFVREVQKGIPGTCAQGSTQEALYFLRTQNYATQYFRPNESIRAINTARVGYLQKFLDPKWFHPSTDLLILVQPETENMAGHTRALELGEEFKKTLSQIAPGRELHILGPHLLPCRLRSEIEHKFNGPMDAALDGEPPDGTPRIRILCFRTDCT